MMSPLPGCTLQKDGAKLSSDVELNQESTNKDHHKQAEMENSQNSTQIIGLIVVKNLMWCWTWQWGTNREKRKEKKAVFSNCFPMNILSPRQSQINEPAKEREQLLLSFLSLN